MSGYSWDEDDQDSNGPKQLRDALEKANREKAALKEQLDKLQGQFKVQSVKEILRELGVKPKVANLIPSTVEPTAEAVTAWVKDYEDVLGATIREPEVKPESGVDKAEPASVPAQPAVDQVTQDALARVQTASAVPGTTTPDAEQQALAWLQAANAAAGDSADKFFDILKGNITITP